MSIKYENKEFKGGSAYSSPFFVVESKKKGGLPTLSAGELFSVYSDKNQNDCLAVYICLGKKELSTEALRELGGKFYKQISKNKNVALDLAAFKKEFGKDSLSYIKGFVEGLLLSDYSLTELKSSKNKSEKVKLTLFTKALTAKELKDLKSLLKESVALSEAVHFTRRLGDLPGNKMTPTLLGKEAQKLKADGIKVSVWGKDRIKKEKMGCLLGVSAGSAEDPKFIIMEYKGKGSKSKQPTVLVGKGLTFDAGGISIKPSAKMDEMRYDMCGGGAVIGAMKLISEMKLPVHVIGLVPSSENLLGAAATKPGDILTAKNGKTVEVLNTDAEGRLILADALSYASTLKPKQVLCTATLTGAMVVALGNSHTGFFTRNEELADKVASAGKASGENLWRMPLTDDHQSDMKGRFADLSNLASFRGAGSATAAAFLENFCAEKIPFAHLDIAGTAWNASQRKSYHGTGATGVLVRSFYEFAKANA